MRQKDVLQPLWRQRRLAEWAQVVEIRGKSPYHENADEFIRWDYRDRTGWRRDEWAHSPLFICGNFEADSPENPSGTT